MFTSLECNQKDQTQVFLDLMQLLFFWTSEHSFKNVSELQVSTVLLFASPCVQTLTMYMKLVTSVVLVCKVSISECTNQRDFISGKFYKSNFPVICNRTHTRQAGSQTCRLTMQDTNKFITLSKFTSDFTVTNLRQLQL